MKNIAHSDIGKEVEFSDDKDFKRLYQDELIDIEQIENETYYRSKQGIWSYCRHIKKTVDVEELLHFIDAEGKRVCAIEWASTI